MRINGKKTLAGKRDARVATQLDNVPHGNNSTLRRERWLPWLLFAFLVLLYLPSLRNQFVYDDEVLIIDQARPERIADFLNVFRERHFPTVPYYRPVTRLTFLAQKYWHDLNPAPYHLFNALLAGAAVLAAFRFLRHPAFRISRPAAAVAALLWAVHPSMSSAVYPVCSGRETLLPSIFILLAVDAWMRPGRRNGFLALFFSILTLFSREQAVVLPVIFLLGDLFDLSGEDRLRCVPLLREIRYRPHGMTVEASAADDACTLTGLLKSGIFWRYATLGMAGLCYLWIRYTLFEGSEFEFGIIEAPLLPLYSYLYALQSFFFPFINLVYEPPIPVWWSWWRVVPAIMLTAGLVWAAWRRGLGWRLLFWSGWFVVVQAPTANILKQEAPFDERYAVLAALALPALAASVYGILAPVSRRLRHALYTGILTLLVAGAGVSLYRGRFFYDDPTFISQWIRTNPWNVDALVNHAKYKIDEEDFETALWAASRAVQQAPEMEGAWYNYGLANYHLGQLEEAVVAFHRALELDPDHEARYNLALSLSDLGHTELAIDTYRAAIERTPGHGDSLYNLALLLARQGDYEAATQYFERAAEVKPDDAEAVYNQGVALEQLQRMDEAVVCYREAIARDPGHTSALYNLATIYFRQRDFESAIRYYSRVLDIDPGDIQARQNLNAARAALRGRTDP